MKPEVEKRELELFLQGQFVIDENEEEKEDASANPLDKKPEEIIEAVVAAASSQDEAEVPPIQYTGSTTNVHPWLSSMVNYAQPVKFQGFDIADRKIKLICHISRLNKLFSQRKISIIICHHLLKQLA